MRFPPYFAIGCVLDMSFLFFNMALKSFLVIFPRLLSYKNYSINAFFKSQSATKGKRAFSALQKNSENRRAFRNFKNIVKAQNYTFFFA